MKVVVRIPHKYFHLSYNRGGSNPSPPPLLWSRVNLLYERRYRKMFYNLFSLVMYNWDKIFWVCMIIAIFLAYKLFDGIKNEYNETHSKFNKDRYRKY